jgi:DNA-binding NtrC family response regulator
LFSLRKAGVLVIDDGSSVADILAMVLNASGFDANAVYSGETVLEIASLRAFDNVGPALAISHIHPDCQVLHISGNEHTSELLQEAVKTRHEFDMLSVCLQHGAGEVRKSAPTELPFDSDPVVATLH